MTLRIVRDYSRGRSLDRERDEWTDIFKARWWEMVTVARDLFLKPLSYLQNKQFDLFGFEINPDELDEGLDVGY